MSLQHKFYAALDDDSEDDDEEDQVDEAGTPKLYRYEKKQT